MGEINTTPLKPIIPINDNSRNKLNDSPGILIITKMAVSNLNAPDKDAVRKHHDKPGIKLDWVMEVNTTA